MLVPLVAIATATSGVGLRCRITGEVIEACCCDDAGGAATKADQPATVSEADCCDRVAREVTATTAEPSAPQPLVPDHATPLPVIAIDALPPERAPARAWSESRSSLSPQTVRLRLLAKSTFLI
ncbi:MAG TPA: hypothetical protein VHJ20_15790 [Polyangia bacterium]|nr:hypothetical protein [Polyangia bacterium]